jgi:hypothetical protein
MTTHIEVTDKAIKEAIYEITELLQRKNIRIEVGAAAMQAILLALKDKGLTVMVERQEVPSGKMN